MLRQSKFTPEFVSLSGHANGSEDGDELADRIPAPDDPAGALQSDDLLKAMLARIAPIYREAFLMREFEGYDYAQIAELTQTTEMNVKVRITRAKKQLRELLAPYFNTDRTRKPKRKTKEIAQFEPDDQEDFSTDDLSLSTLAL
jgi:RNA polymerase sigma-70 factor (ECF subfamily)